MTTDRKLLKLAAKATGINLIWFDSMCDIPERHSGITNFHWNPLTDHGDLYRLEHDLRMSIDRETGTVRRGTVSESFIVGDCISEAYAIVRTAAEIGRNME